MRYVWGPDVFSGSGVMCILLVLVPIGDCCMTRHTTSESLKHEEEEEEEEEEGGGGGEGRRKSGDAIPDSEYRRTPLPSDLISFPRAFCLSLSYTLYCQFCLDNHKLCRVMYTVQTLFPSTVSVYKTL